MFKSPALDEASESARPTLPPRWVREAEAAAYLSVHTATLRRRRLEGLVSAKKIGAAVLYNVDELDRFMADAPDADGGRS